MIRSMMLVAAMAAGLVGCASHHHRSTGSETLLYLRLPEVRQVQIATSVDGYRLHPAVCGLFGTWEISVPATGEFQYFYVVDGAVYRPDCRYRQTDDFGSQNCIHHP